MILRLVIMKGILTLMGMLRKEEKEYISKNVLDVKDFIMHSHVEVDSVKIVK